MSRILFWLGLVFLVVFAIRSKLREAAQRNEQLRRQQQGAAPSPAAGAGAGYQARAASQAVAEAETMLCCAHCGVYYPASETVQLNGRDYCSSAHAGLPPA
ncbi:MAG: PP0621 family protein [Sphingomonadaceae bacterium]